VTEAASAETVAEAVAEFLGETRVALGS